MKFGDVVTCVASIVVIFALIAGPLDMVSVSALGISRMNEWGYDVSLIVYFFLSALISGYIFAEKLQEGRREAITKIAVLWAALVMLVAIIVPATVADWGSMVKDEYLAKNPGATLSTLSTSEWVTWEMMFLDLFMFLVVVMALVLGFIGLYIGSMLRKPKKS